MLIKKISFWLISICIGGILCSCGVQNLSMIVPSGSTQLAQLYLEDSDAYQTTIVQGADPIVSAFASESYDIIIAPTNLGAKLFQSKPSYQLAASITWGNYYLVSKQVISMESLKNQTIVAFGQNQTPDAIMQYVLEDSLIDIIYLDSTASVVSDFIMDGSKIYLVAEPSLSILKATYTLSIVDIQTLYKQKTGKDFYPQASVFVHHELSDRDVQKIKADFKDSIKHVVENPSQAALLAIKLGMSIDKEVIESAIGHSHMIYVSSEHAKTDILFYLEMLKEFNVNFTGETLPDDTFYR